MVFVLAHVSLVFESACTSLSSNCVAFSSNSVSEFVVASTTNIATLNLHKGAPFGFLPALPHLSPSHMSWCSVHLGASLGNFNQNRTSHSAAMFCQHSKWKNRHLLRCSGPGTYDSRNATQQHVHSLNHPVLYRCFRPHICLSSDMFRTLESQLPTSDLIVFSILTRAHGDLLVTCGTVTRNAITWSSASGATVAVPIGRELAITRFHFVSARFFSLVLLCHLA